MFLPDAKSGASLNWVIKFTRLPVDAAVRFCSSLLSALILIIKIKTSDYRSFLVANPFSELDCCSFSLNVTSFSTAEIATFKTINSKSETAAAFFSPLGLHAEWEIFSIHSVLTRYRVYFLFIFHSTGFKIEVSILMTPCWKRMALFKDSSDYYFKKDDTLKENIMQSRWVMSWRKDAWMEKSDLELWGILSSSLVL